MLKFLFAWLDAHAWFYWLAAAVTLAAWLTAALREKENASRGWRSALPWLTLAVLVAWRWPILLNARELNPDESQQIAGAITLGEDAVFWRSVDGATAGPVNYYALAGLRLFGLPLDYFTARALGLLLVWGMLLNLRRVIAGFGSEGSWLGLLPGLAFFAAVQDYNFVHFSTEHVPLFLASAALARLVASARLENDRSRWRWACAGLATGLVPWAKLQGLPLAGALVIVAVVLAWPGRVTRAGNLVAFSLGLLLPTFVIVSVVVAAGEGGTLWRSYIQASEHYLGGGMPWGMLLARWWYHTSHTWIFQSFLAAAAAWGVAGWWLPRKSGAAPVASRVAMLAFGVAAIAAAMAPRRDFPHYLLFVVLALALWVGLGAGGIIAATREAGWSRRWVGFGVVALGLLPVGLRLLQPSPAMIGSLADHWREPRTELGEVVHRLARPGDRLAVWGWGSQLYVECGLAQGTRDAHTQRQIEDSPLREYYRARYLADLQRKEPRLFVDVVAPRAFAYADRASQGHETFAALRDYVAANYRLEREVDGARVFVRGASGR